MTKEKDAVLLSVVHKKVNEILSDYNFDDVFKYVEDIGRRHVKVLYVENDDEMWILNSTIQNLLEEHFEELSDSIQEAVIPEWNKYIDTLDDPLQAGVEIIAVLSIAVLVPEFGLVEYSTNLSLTYSQSVGVVQVTYCHNGSDYKPCVVEFPNLKEYQASIAIYNATINSDIFEENNIEADFTLNNIEEE